MTNEDISAITGINNDDLSRAVQWLLDHKVIKQDSRSIRAGHQVTDARAYFYTVDGHCSRGLLSVILEYENESKTIEAEDSREHVAQGNLEGARQFVYASRIERNHRNRIDAIHLHGYKCQACGFDFANTYGELGRNFIEVHHINPLSEQNGEQIVNPTTDLVCLCANCHRMVHRNRKQVLTLEELRGLLRDNKKV